MIGGDELSLSAVEADNSHAPAVGAANKWVSLLTQIPDKAVSSEGGAGRGEINTETAPAERGSPTKGDNVVRVVSSDQAGRAVDYQNDEAHFIGLGG